MPKEIKAPPIESITPEIDFDCDDTDDTSYDDELEAIRLVDLEGMEQNKAGKKMKISQSTLSRLLKTGRKKLSKAIINGQAIKIQGGNFKMVQSQGRGFGKGRGMGRGRMGGLGAGPEGICKCPKCGYEEPKTRGVPCMSKKCPKCQTPMIRKN